MKKALILCLPLALCLLFAGCGGDDSLYPGANSIDSNRPISSYISKDITEIEVKYSVAGTDIEWTSIGREAEGIRKWVNGLECELAEFEEGKAPGDYDGGALYKFAYTADERFSFSYVDVGHACYLLIEGEWYTVKNPSEPPFTNPLV